MLHRAGLGTLTFRLIKETKMELFKNFDTKTINTTIDNTVDQVEKTAAQVLSYVQPETVRENVLTLNKAYFEFARTSLTNAKTFGSVVEKLGKDFTKNVEKATKVA